MLKDQEHLNPSSSLDEIEDSLNSILKYLNISASIVNWLVHEPKPFVVLLTRFLNHDDEPTI